MSFEYSATGYLGFIGAALFVLKRHFFVDVPFCSSFFLLARQPIFHTSLVCFAYKSS